MDDGTTSSRSEADALLSALEVAGIGVWSLHLPSGTVSCNESFRKLLGVPVDGPLALEVLLQRAHPHDAPLVREQTRILMEERRGVRYRTRVVRANDGALRWIEATGSIVASGDSATGTLRDVTDEVLARDALEVGRKRLEMAVIGSQVGAWEWDLAEDRVVHEALPVSLGYTQEESPRSGAAWTALQHPDDRERAREQFASILEGRVELIESEMRVLAKDGTYRWLVVRAGPVRAPSGEVVRIVGTTVDVQDRKLAEEQLRAEFRVFESILEHLPVVVTFYDIATGRFSWVNGCAERVLGWTRDEWLESDILSKLLVDAGKREEATVYMQEGPLGTWARFHNRTRDGRVLEIAWCNVRLPDGRMMGIGQDVTFEAQLQQTQKLESLGVLAGGIAHDFNNLLVGILANASLARSEVSESSSLGEILGDVERSAERLAELTRQLLAYAGKGRFVIQTLDLGALVREMTTLLSAAVSKRAVLRVDLPRSLPPVEVDATQIRQVVMNLITNASDALGDGHGDIVLRGDVVDVEREQTAAATGPVAPGRYVSLEVIDTGCGMPADTLRQIFEPFFTTKFAGRGLGLAATVGIVRSHGGALDVESEVGRGTRFRLLLPVALGAAAPSARAGGASPLHVLIVEDDVLVAQVAKRILERRGFRVTLVADVPGALAAVGTDTVFALVLLDANTPNGEASTLIGTLGAHHPGVPVLVTSGALAAAETLTGPNVVGFLPKPFGNEDLVAAVIAATRSSRPA